MPYTTAVPGTTITSAYANANIRDQVVTPFASASARTSAIVSPVDGMLSSLTDSDSLWYYDGTAWVVPNLLYVRKTSDETVTSSTTLQNDDQLLLPVAANAVYWIEGFVIYTSTATGKIKTGWTGPAGATFQWASDALDQTVTAASAEKVWRSVNTIADSQAWGTAGTGVPVVGMPKGVLITAGTSGNFQFQWAQNTSDGTATTVKIGSILTARRLA